MSTELTNTDSWEIPSHDKKIFRAKRWPYAIVIPVINEGERIQNQLRKIFDLGLQVDVIIADGGSTDGSLSNEFLQGVGVRTLLTKTGSGRLSAQLRMAYTWCLCEGYEGIITVDGNDKDGMEAVVEMVSRLEDGYDYVQGSRYLLDGVAENTPFDRTIGNRLIHAPLLSIAGKHRYTDTTNGFRAYSARYLRDSRVQPFRNVFQDYELLFYLTIRAGQIGMKVGQIPVERRYPQEGATPTKISGFSSKIDVLSQTINAASGAFTPDLPKPEGLRWTLFALALFVAIVSSLYFAFNSAPPYSPDSWAFYELSQTISNDFYRFTHWRSYANETSYSSSFPPLWPIMVAAFDTVFKSGAHAPFHLAILSFMIFALLSELLVRQAFYAKWLGLGTALLMLTDSRMLIEEISAGRTIPLQMAILTGLTLVLLRTKKMNMGAGLALGALSGLAVMNRFDAIFFPILLFAWLLLYKRNIWAVIACACTAALVCMPWILYSITHFGTVFATDNSGIAFSADRAAFVTDWWSTLQPTVLDDPFGWLYKITINLIRLIVVFSSTLISPIGFIFLIVLFLWGRRTIFSDKSKQPIASLDDETHSLHIKTTFGFMIAALIFSQLPQILTGYIDPRYFSPLLYMITLLVLGYFAKSAGSDAQRSLICKSLYVIIAVLVINFGLRDSVLWRASTEQNSTDAQTEFLNPSTLTALNNCIEKDRLGRVLVIGDNTLVAQMGALENIQGMMEPRNMERGRLDVDGRRMFIKRFSVDHILVLDSERLKETLNVYPLSPVGKCNLDLFRVSQY